jgi:hypothetical protein
MKPKDQPKSRRAFNWFTKAWYGKSQDLNEISFGMYYDGETTDEMDTGEMFIRWHDIGDKKMVPRLEAFDDGWFLLHEFSDVLEKLAEVNDQNISQEQFVEILLSCGFKDITAYKNPQSKTVHLSALENELAFHESRAKAIREKIAKR